MLPTDWSPPPGQPPPSFNDAYGSPFDDYPYYTDSSISPTMATAIASLATSTFTSIVASATSSYSPSAIPSFPVSSSEHKPTDPDENNGECELLGPFAIIVQAALGALALLSLVYKRWRERPQRPVKIWAFDASKQVFGSALLHLANLVMSMFSAGKIDVAVAAATATAAKGYTPNPCSFYLLNLAIDTTLGIPILIILLRLITAAASLTPIARPAESIESGHYGTPPRWSWWFKQSIIYFLGLLGMKFCVFFLFAMLPWISRIGDWALRWTEGNEALQIAFVMLIFPLIMNALQYYIVDSFIKRKNSDHEIIEDMSGDDDEDEHGNERSGLISREDSDADVSDEEVGQRGRSRMGVSRGASVASKKSEAKLVTKEYDPNEDGESSRPASGTKAAFAEERK